MLGFDSHNPVLNLGTLSIVVALYILKLVIFLVIVRPLRTNKHVKKCYKYMMKTLFFGEILVILLEAHIEICLAGTIMMQVPKKQFNQDNNIMMWTLGGLFLFLSMIFLPVLFLWLFTKKLRYLKLQKYKRRMGVLTTGVRLHTKWHAAFYFFFVIRRITYVLVYFSLDKYSTFQIQIISFCNLIQLIYIGYVKP